MKYLGEYPAILEKYPRHSQDPGLSIYWNLHRRTYSPTPRPELLFRAAYRRRRGIGPTRYAAMELPRLARPEGCCDMTVHLCEDYGLGYLGQPWAVPGSLEHPLHRRLDSTSATGRTPQRTAGIGTYGPRAVSGLRNVTGRRLRTHRDLGRERAAYSTYRRIYLRSSRPPGPNRARTGGGPKELRISEQLGI